MVSVLLSWMQAKELFRKGCQAMQKAKALEGTAEYLYSEKIHGNMVFP